MSNHPLITIQAIVVPVCVPAQRPEQPQGPGAGGPV